MVSFMYPKPWKRGNTYWFTYRDREGKYQGQRGVTLPRA